MNDTAPASILAGIPRSGDLAAYWAHRREMAGQQCAAEIAVDQAARDRASIIPGVLQDAPAVTPQGIRLTTCGLHKSGAPVSTMAQAGAEALRLRGSAVGLVIARALSMGGGCLGAPCCPAVAYSRDLMASAFRAEVPAGGGR